MVEVDSTVISLGLNVIALGAGYFYFSMNQRNFQTQYNDKIVALETKMDLFWKALEAQIPGMLMKGNPIATDSRLFELLEKFTQKQITDMERCDLIHELEREAKNEDHTPGERISMMLFSASQRAQMPHDQEVNCNHEPVSDS